MKITLFLLGDLSNGQELHEVNKAVFIITIVVLLALLFLCMYITNKNKLYHIEKKKEKIHRVDHEVIQ